MKTMPILVPAMLMLAACTPTATEVASAATPPTADVNSASTPASPAAQIPATTARAEPVSMPPNDKPAAAPASATISGAIANGNRPPPALRVCATPVDGGRPSCIDTQEGASEYRVEVAPGRYVVLGWVQSGELTLIAHASQIRCIRAPCPPDALIEITVAAGQQREGIDLNGAYVDIPEGWPKRPA